MSLGTDENTLNRHSFCRKGVNQTWSINDCRKIYGKLSSDKKN